MDRKFYSGIFASLATLTLPLPLFLHWFIHGSYERYLWIINGPWPFSHLGGGPFQFVLSSCVFLVSFLFFYLSFVFYREN